MSLSFRAYFLLTIAALTGLGLSACTTPSSDAPPVADSTFVEVLLELHLADARLDHVKETPEGLRDSILARYGLDTTRFNAVIGYYADHPEAYIEIYNTLLDRINDERLP